MNYLLDTYIKKPEYVKELFGKSVSISLKIDGSAFQIAYDKSNDKLSYHKRGGSSSKLGPVIDDYTQLFAKYLNDAIEFFDKKKDILKEYKFYAIEIFNDMYILLNVVDHNDNLVDNVSDIAKKLNIDSVPILYNGKLNNEQIDNVLSMMTLSEDISNEEFISLLKKLFGNGKYVKFLKGSEIEGIVFTWQSDDKIEQFKIINPAFKKRHGEEIKAGKERNKLENESEDFINLFKKIYEVTQVYYKKNHKSIASDSWIKKLNNLFINIDKDEILKLASKLEPNDKSFWSLQVNKLDPKIKEILKDKSIIVAYEKFLFLLYKPRKRNYIIDKEFQLKVNSFIEILQSKNESLSLKDYIL